jgi:hypothetical protein
MQDSVRAGRLAVAPRVRSTLDGMEEARPSLAKRALALLVFVIAAWVLLKVVIGIIAGLSTAIVVILAIMGIVWAYRTL